MIKLLKKLKLNTIKGRITFSVFILVFIYSIFCTYVFVENRQIRDNFIALNEQGEPALTKVFISTTWFTQSLSAVQRGMITGDTSARTDFKNALKKGFDNIVDIVKHVDTLGVNIQEQMLQIEKTDEEYQKKCMAIFDAIHEADDTAAFQIKYGTTSANYFKDIYNNELHPLYWGYMGQVFGLLQYSYPAKTAHVEALNSKTERIVVIISTMIILTLFISFFAWRKLNNYLTISIQKILNSIQRITNGEFVIEKITNDDEVGEVLLATNNLTNSIENASKFADEIGKGKFADNFQPAHDKDTLGHALLQMREELKKFKEEDQKRFWINQGYAEFNELARKHNSDVNESCEIFISNLVKYTKCNQGSVFILKENEITKEFFLQRAGCYAYDRKKYLNDKILIGEGLIGQAFLEKEHMHLTKVPANYITITSGLGEATPNCILIVPMVYDDKALGVIELASFKYFEKYQIDFIKKLGETIASVLINIQNNSHSRVVLEQLQQTTQQMKNQEEELKQNMEELMATQEELLRKEKEYKKTIEALSAQVKQKHTQEVK